MISGKDLIKYIISYYGKVSAKQLQKLAYLTELEYMKKHGERLSDLEFVKFYYGPYSFGIKEIQDEDDNIIEHIDNNKIYTYKEYQLKENNVKIDPALKIEINKILDKYKDKTGMDLELIADKTEPFIDCEYIGEKIDLDGYAEHYKDLLSEEFWKKAFEIREENEKKGVYGKRIIKDKSELESFFS
jgi:uncharacterized phage-associated protein